MLVKEYLEGGQNLLKRYIINSFLNVRRNAAYEVY